jgi:hypothetical protein
MLIKQKKLMQRIKPKTLRKKEEEEKKYYEAPCQNLNFFSV